MTTLSPTPGPWRHAGKSEAELRTVFEGIVRSDAEIMRVLMLARALDLPDWLIVSGVLYQTVWNHLTGRPARYGQRDIDLVYCDTGDLGYAAEDAVIRRAAEVFAGISLPVEVRNQARVHLWFEARFGAPYAPLTASADGLQRYASRAHAVGVRLEEDDRLTIVAPFGLDDIFALRIRRNTSVIDNGGHAAKGARMLALWPEVRIDPA